MIPDWNWGSTFLSGGRKKYERPLYDRSLRIWKENKWDADSPINIGWMYSGRIHKFVTFHKDGTTVITGAPTITPWNGSWQPLTSQSVRLTIQRYAGIQVFQRNHKFYLQEYDAPLTKPKIQGCRQCSQTGLVDGWCSTVTCYDVETNEKGFETCPKHPDMDVKGNRYWHNMPCVHGNDQSHMVKRGQTCYSCGGSKKRDYGSKPERTQWDGTPLRLRDGKMIKSAASLLERMVADYVEPIG